MKVNFTCFLHGMKFRHKVTNNEYIIVKSNVNSILSVVCMSDYSIISLSENRRFLKDECILINPSLDDYLYECGDMFRTFDNKIFLISCVEHKIFRIIEITKEIQRTPGITFTQNVDDGDYILGCHVYDAMPEVYKNRYTYIGHICDLLKDEVFNPEKNK